MLRLMPVLLISIGGYLVFQNRFRLMNVFFGNRMIRRVFVTMLMSIPSIRNKVVGTVFPEPANR